MMSSTKWFFQPQKKVEVAQHLHRNRLIISTSWFFIIHSKGFANTRISQKFTFMNLWIKLALKFLILQDVIVTSKHIKILSIWVPLLPHLVWFHTSIWSNENPVDHIGCMFTASAQNLWANITCVISSMMWFLRSNLQFQFAIYVKFYTNYWYNQLMWDIPTNKQYNTNSKLKSLFFGDLKQTIQIQRLKEMKKFNEELK